MRIIYLGTPVFAVPTLEALIKEPEFEVVAALCQPDRPKGRGKQVQAPPVKELAIAHGIQVFQPEKLSKDKQVVEAMQALNPDVLVMVAFGQILKKAVLEMAPHGVINLHGSLLPELRGAAPINWAIINGLKKTGNTTMCTEAGVDTGPMLLKNEVIIHENMDAEELSKELATTGAPLMVETLLKLKAGSLKSIRQDDSKASHAPLLSKDTGLINWSDDAQKIHNLVRGLRPWPGTQTGFRDNKIKIIETRLVKDEFSQDEAMEAGSLIVEKKRIMVACGASGDDRIELLTVQPQNKAKLKSIDWANGSRVTSGEKLELNEIVSAGNK